MSPYLCNIKQQNYENKNNDLHHGGIGFRLMRQLRL